MRQLILVFDYGGTKHTVALLERGGRSWLAHRRVYSPPGADARYDQRTTIELAHELLAATPGTLVAVGVSFGGPVDAARGIVRLSHHVPGWEETPLGDMLRAEFCVPVAIDNDANIAALGEWAYGAGQGCTSLLYVTVSTGIGGGWVLDGKIWHGADSMAGEIGHIVVRPGGVECVCGKRGCLEAEACGWGIARKMRDRLGSRATDDVTAAWVAQAAQHGDPVAQEVLDDAARMLGTGLGGAINLMNPQRVVLGGGVTKSGERYWRLVRETARYHALPQMSVNIQPAALGDDAPLWGAAVLAQATIS